MKNHFIHTREGLAKPAPTRHDAKPCGTLVYLLLRVMWVIQSNVLSHVLLLHRLPSTLGLNPWTR